MQTEKQDAGTPVQTTTRIPLPFDQVSSLFKAEATRRDISVSILDDGITLNARSGDIHLVREKNGVRLTLSAADRTKLHFLQEAIDQSLDAMNAAAGRQWSLTEPGAYPPNLTFATVESCDRISPSYFRVALSAPDIMRFSSGGLHFRLLFAPREHAGKWPAIAENGRTEWPGGMQAWHRPVYTTRRIDPEAGTLTFDVFVHDGGRVTEWCRTVRRGDEIALTGPGGEWYPGGGWIALFGDETALPAIARILAARPGDTSGVATIMVGGAEDIQELDKPEGISVRWLFRDGDETLIDALAGLELPDADRFVWFASERAEVFAVREALMERGLEKSEMRAAVFWTRLAGIA